MAFSAKDVDGPQEKTVNIVVSNAALPLPLEAVRCKRLLERNEGAVDGYGFHRYG